MKERKTFSVKDTVFQAAAMAIEAKARQGFFYAFSLPVGTGVTQEEIEKEFKHPVETLIYGSVVAPLLKRSYFDSYQV